MPAEIAAYTPAKPLRPPGPWASFWHAFRENKGAVIGMYLVIAIIFMAIFAPLLAPHDPLETFANASRLPPFWEAGADPRFLLGTDPVGRDMLSRLIWGARVSLLIGISVMAVSMVAGVALGLMAAWFGGVLDVITVRLMDVIMAIPSLVLAILIIAIIGPGLLNTIIAITILYIPRYVLLVRASALVELARDYVTAARVAGVRPLRLMLKTVLPNCTAPLIVQGALGISDAILEAAGLGFLGLGAQLPTPEWGTMMGSVRDLMLSNPWQMALPGLAIFITLMAINLMSDGLRDALDPRLRRS